MENKKIRYQLDRLPMLLFLACLAITVVAASHDKSIDNLYSPFYYGDSNVTEGKQFWISCRAEPPISWYKDGEPIEKHFVRDGEDEFTYTTSDHLRDDLTGKVESKLSVSRAVLRHKGKYQCNINHENSHVLNVNPAPVLVESEEVDEGFAAFAAEDDHEEERIRFEQPLEEDQVTESSKFFSSPDFETAEETVLDYDDDGGSHEKFIEEPTVAQSISVTTTFSPSLTNIPLHPTHANHVVHTTHEVPSEVQTQNHPETHRHKGKLTPKYNEGEKVGYKLFKIGKPLVLNCASENAAENEKIVWSRIDDKNVKKNVREFSDIKDRLKISSKESTFSIERARDDDAGNYTCSLGDESHIFNVYAAVVVQVPRYVYGVEEEKLEIECIVKGTYPMVSWEHRTDTGNESYPVREDNERIKMLEYKDVEDAKLVIEKANLSDRGYYTCIGWNELMKEEDRAKDIAYARVKDKLAALWPFLGICAEVFVLCAIILIYEKRRNKTELEESDTDQSPDQKNDPKDSDVRHRK